MEGFSNEQATEVIKLLHQVDKFQALQHAEAKITHARLTIVEDKQTKHAKYGLFGFLCLAIIVLASGHPDQAAKLFKFITMILP